MGHRFHEGPWLFHDLSFRLEPGEIVGICGPSGSGKSTLLSLIAGFEDPTSGSVQRFGINRICWVFQNPHGMPRRTAIDHVTQPLLGQGMNRVQAESQALAIMEDFHLIDVCARDFKELSGGEAQRLMLARAVASRPDLLLVDEPTAQLDQLTAADVDRTLAGIAQADCIVAVATHDPNTRSACTRVIDLARHRNTEKQ
nr:ATP-binding cassette domain-containing protein [Bombiscardovia coagulans]